MRVLSFKIQIAGFFINLIGCMIGTAKVVVLSSIASCRSVAGGKASGFLWCSTESPIDVRRSKFKLLRRHPGGGGTLASAARSIASAIAATASFWNEVSQWSAREFDPTSKTLWI